VLITLTSDFGSRDPYVGIMKGRILQRCADATLIDLTHELTPYRPEEAGFWLWRSIPWFPPGSVHVAVVDPGVGTGRALVVARAHGQLYLAPDNGLLGLVVQADAAAETRHIEVARLGGRLGVATPSATFHGRDLLAPLAAELAAGRCAPEDLGPVAAIRPGALTPAALHNGVWTGAIGAIDRFGNLLSTIDAEQLKHPAAATVELGGRRLPMVRTYGEAAEGSYVALVNAFGVLEVARVCGNAAEGLGVQWGSPFRAWESAEATPS
jgi:S-adenosylmethionine hydrolase